MKSSSVCSNSIVESALEMPARLSSRPSTGRSSRCPDTPRRQSLVQRPRGEAFRRTDPSPRPTPGRRAGASFRKENELAPVVAPVGRVRQQALAFQFGPRNIARDANWSQPPRRCGRASARGAFCNESHEDLGDTSDLREIIRPLPGTFQLDRRSPAASIFSRHFPFTSCVNATYSSSFFFASPPAIARRACSMPVSIDLACPET